MWQPPRSADGYLVWALSGAGTVPTLRIKDPAYQEKMANIDAALARCDADNPVFYEDEVDIDLNPKLGADWMFRAQQKRVVTPGQNAKHYLAGVLHAGNGRVLYVSGIKKNSSLFIAMLEKLRHHYPTSQNHHVDPR